MCYSCIEHKLSILSVLLTDDNNRLPTQIDFKMHVFVVLFTDVLLPNNYVLFFFTTFKLKKKIWRTSKIEFNTHRTPHLPR